MKFKFLGKKATDSGPASQLPMQAFIEIFLIISLGIAFFAYGAFLVNDLRMFQVFLSKDISLMQNSIVLIDDPIFVAYSPTSNYKLNLFSYRFKPIHTDVIYLDSDKVSLDEGVVRSYIHFKFNPSSNDEVEKVIRNPNTIYFYKMGDLYNIGTDWRDVMQGRVSLKECGDFNLMKNTLFYFDYLNYIKKDSNFNHLLFTTPINLYLSSMVPNNFNKYLSTFNYNVDSFKDLSSENKAYFIFEESVSMHSTRDNIRIIIPDNDNGVFGCVLYNGLISRHKNDIDISLIQTSTLSQFNNDFNYSTYIILDNSRIDFVLNTLKEVIVNYEKD
jgi:hypothetical protein